MKSGQSSIDHSQVSSSQSSPINYNHKYDMMYENDRYSMLSALLPSIDTNTAVASVTVAGISSNHKNASNKAAAYLNTKSQASSSSSSTENRLISAPRLFEFQLGGGINGGGSSAAKTSNERATNHYFHPFPPKTDHYTDMHNHDNNYIDRSTSNSLRVKRLAYHPKILSSDQSMSTKTPPTSSHTQMTILQQQQQQSSHSVSKVASRLYAMRSNANNNAINIDINETQESNSVDAISLDVSKVRAEAIKNKFLNQKIITPAPVKSSKI